MTMKRFFSILSLVFVGMVAISCYDDTKVWEKINSIDKTLTELTTQVNSVATLVQALEGNNYIKDVKEVTGGYEIEFTNGDKITIQNGKDGSDAPEIGAVKDVDGIYYWTLDGEWLLDAAGNKIPAGMGQPKLKTEDGLWYISADGKEWALIGPDVACTIKNVVVAEDVVTFTLADGTEIAIPIVKALDITFNVQPGHIYDATTFDIEYAIVGGTDQNRISVMSPVAAVTVKATDANSGVLTVSVEERVDFEFTVFVTDGVSRTIFRTLTFISGVFQASSENVYVESSASTITVPVVTSMDYDVLIDCDWITVAPETKAEIREEEVVLNVAATDAYAERSATVSLVPTDEAYASMTISFTVYQAGRANKVWTKHLSSYEGYDATQKVRLAKYGDYILLANTTKVYLLDPATGDVASTIAMPEGVAAQSVLVDDAGNLMIASDAAYGSVLTLYYVPDPMNPVPEKVCEFNTANYYGTDCGNVRVRGDIKGDAVITATVSAGAGGAAIIWEVVDGVCGDWSWTSVAYEGSTVASACTTPAGPTLADGLFYIGYGGDYNLYYVKDVTKGAASTWATTYVTGSSWMENYNCIATAEWNDTKYAAICAGCHFNYDDADAILLNVNDPAAAQHIYTYAGTPDVDRADDWTNLNWTGGGSYSDILLATSEDTLLMVYVDSNYGAMSCVAVK